MKYEDIIHRCFRCGFCKLTDDYEEFNCPPHKKYRLESFSPGGRMWLIRARIKGDVQISERYQQILYSCTLCANCVTHCIFPFKEDLVNIFTAARESLVEEGTLPPAVRDYLKSIQTYGNPYKEPSAKRGDWANGLSVPAYDGQEYLLYIGCVGSYDERARKIARSVALLLKTLNISFGILGAEEICDGNEVRALGETWLFEGLAQRNIEYFKTRNIKKIITLDPHAYNAFTLEYKTLGADLEVYHYTQILAEKTAALADRLKTDPLEVTYHDPCYLGRHNNLYDEPRKILAALPGVKFAEMVANRGNALCCGGGGGNFFSDILGGGKESPARIRVAQAKETGAGIISIACPQCAKMLEDAVKAEDLEDKLAVKDIAELVLSRLETK
ncbi:MAG: succinate dehydrogenase/fumarate reductase iron-sulfur subunit [Smithella sp. PtaU1.Bin162]|nr:MAG: succinate dehydrogenase/fumarate reductase iron-sulfur subunit [Smithella sp. PtaU1.Bin162]